MSVRSLWRLWALALVAAVLAMLNLQTPPSDDMTLVAAARKEARLPHLAPPPVPVDPAPALTKLSQSTLWGPLAPRPASGAAGGAAPSPAKWGLTGFYERTGTRFVIVSFEQQALPTQQLKLGDRLPDGSRIERIEPDRVRARRARASSTSAPSARWLPITPGLSAAPPNDKR
ncbi:MAG: hypothetical protein MUF08_02270 [Burkholderiaceae bacterium]|nr:hypothetical protein [Burkholderiaceae bacterium]